MAGADEVQGSKTSRPDTPEQHAQEARSIPIATESQYPQKQEADQEPAERNHVLTGTRKLPIPSQERERAQERHQRDSSYNDIGGFLFAAQHPHSQQAAVEQAQASGK